MSDEFTIIENHGRHEVIDKAGIVYAREEAKATAIIMRDRLNEKWNGLLNEFRELEKSFTNSGSLIKQSYRP